MVVKLSSASGDALEKPTFSRASIVLLLSPSFASSSSEGSLIDVGAGVASLLSKLVELGSSLMSVLARVAFGRSRSLHRDGRRFLDSVISSFGGCSKVWLSLG
jgi:hypothetical protein